MDAGEDHGLSRARLTRQLESSLDRLGVDHVDLYLAHEFDPDTPLDETVATLEGLQQIGLIRAWGVSNFDAVQLRALFELGRPAVVQNSYSLLARGDEEEVIELCTELGISYTPFGPLAGGLLSGKYRSGEAATGGLAPRDAAGAVRAPARARTCSPASTASPPPQRTAASRRRRSRSPGCSHNPRSGGRHRATPSRAPRTRVSALDVRLSEDEAATITALF